MTRALSEQQISTIGFENPKPIGDINLSVKEYLFNLQVGQLCFDNQYYAKTWSTRIGDRVEIYTRRLMARAGRIHLARQANNTDDMLNMVTDAFLIVTSLINSLNIDTRNLLAETSLDPQTADLASMFAELKTITNEDTSYPIDILLTQQTNFIAQAIDKYRHFEPGDHATTVRTIARKLFILLAAYLWDGSASHEAVDARIVSRLDAHRNGTVYD